MDAEYRNRNYNALEKSKIPIKEIKQILKEEFAHYRISYENGRLRLRRQKGSLLFNFFFKYNSNIFQPYFEIYLNEEKLENLVNPLTSGVSLCRYLLNDREYLSSFTTLLLKFDYFVFVNLLIFDVKFQVFL